MPREEPRSNPGVSPATGQSLLRKRSSRNGLCRSARWARENLDLLMELAGRTRINPSGRGATRSCGPPRSSVPLKATRTVVPVADAAKGIKRTKPPSELRPTLRTAAHEAPISAMTSLDGLMQGEDRTKLHGMLPELRRDRLGTSLGAGKARTAAAFLVFSIIRCSPARLGTGGIVVGKMNFVRLVERATTVRKQVLVEMSFATRGLRPGKTSATAAGIRRSHSKTPLIFSLTHRLFLTTHPLLGRSGPHSLRCPDPGLSRQGMPQAQVQTLPGPVDGEDHRRETALWVGEEDETRAGDRPRLRVAGIRIEMQSALSQPGVMRDLLRRGLMDPRWTPLARGIRAWTPWMLTLSPSATPNFMLLRFRRLRSSRTDRGRASLKLANLQWYLCAASGLQRWRRCRFASDVHGKQAGSSGRRRG
mmetsp:Transcript_48557/g.128415  ORF Transcript_48557/g.128415 Transcript_48557/m.128415 type:complete len:420 (-) Transcript_48557:158-1417(-)